MTIIEYTVLIVYAFLGIILLFAGICAGSRSLVLMNEYRTALEFDYIRRPGNLKKESLGYALLAFLLLFAASLIFVFLYHNV
jgi:hypothetical protein